MTAIDRGRPSSTPAIPDLADAATRLTTVKVNLLPAEVVLARRGQKVRRIAIAAVALLAVLLAGASFVARGGVGAAEADLAGADALSASLRAQQGRFAEVVTLQETARSAQERLDRLTAGDLDWAPLLSAVTAAVPAGLTVVAIDATTEDSGAAGSVGGAPGGTGATTADPAATAAVAVGVLAITGQAVDPAAVATFVDALSRVKGLESVVATGVARLGDAAAGATGYSYGITAAITTAAARPTGSATATATTTAGGR